MKLQLLTAFLMVSGMLMAQDEKKQFRRHELALQPVSPFAEERVSSDPNLFIPVTTVKKYYPTALQYRFHFNDKWAARAAYRVLSDFDNNTKHSPFQGGEQKEYNRIHFLSNLVSLGAQRVFRFERFSFYTGLDIQYGQEESLELRNHEITYPGTFNFLSENRSYRITHLFGGAIPFGMTYSFSGRCGILLETSVDYRKGTVKEIDHTHTLQKNLGTGEVINDSYAWSDNFSKPEKWYLFAPSNARMMVYYRF